MLTIHCSALPRALGRDGCPASLALPKVNIATSSDDSNLGNAVHEAGALHVRGIEVDLSAVADKWGVEPSALGPLFHQLRRLWEGYRDALEVVGTEQQVEADVFEDLRITGTADVLARVRGGDNDDMLVDIDFKSTEGRDPLAQQIAYGVSYFGGNPEPFKTVGLFLREGMAVVHDVSDAPCQQPACMGSCHLTEWKRDLRYALDHVEGKDEKFHASPSNCLFCARQTECPARLQLARASWEIVTSPGEEWRALTPAAKGELYLKVQFAAKFIETIRDMYREEIKANGPLPLADGREVALIPNTRETIQVEEAWPVMAKEFGLCAEDVLHIIAPAVTIAKGKLTDIIGAGAAKGHKGAVINAFLDALRAANALTELVGEPKLCARKQTKEG